MFDTEMTARVIDEAAYQPSTIEAVLDGSLHGDEELLAIALDLLKQGNPEDADRILTAQLLTNPGNASLWLAAGISRLRKGAVRTASAAFKMSCWLSDDLEARELLNICEQIEI